MGQNLDIKNFDTNLGISYSQYASDKLGRDLWVVKRGFVYNLDMVGHERIVVPKGYLTDGASVPRALWSFLPPWGRYGQAAVLHDWLCEYLGYWEGQRWTRMSRDRCDSIFNDAMKELKVSKLTRTTMYHAVVIYGHMAAAVNQSFDPKKHEVEKFLLQHYDDTGEWI